MVIEEGNPMACDKKKNPMARMEEDIDPASFEEPYDFYALPEHSQDRYASRGRSAKKNKLWRPSRRSSSTKANSRRC